MAKTKRRPKSPLAGRDHQGSSPTGDRSDTNPGPGQRQAALEDPGQTDWFHALAGDLMMMMMITSVLVHVHVQYVNAHVHVFCFTYTYQCALFNPKRSDRHDT